MKKILKVIGNIGLVFGITILFGLMMTLLIGILTPYLKWVILLLGIIFITLASLKYDK